MVPTSNGTGCFGASMVLGPQHDKQELYIITVDYQNKNKTRVGEWQTKGRSRIAWGEKDIHRERAKAKDKERQILN